MKFVCFCLWLVCTYGFSQTFTARYELSKLKEANSVNHDAGPVISPDGKKLYFFVVGKDGSQDINMITKDDHGVWSPPEKMGSLNHHKTNAVFQVMHDGTLLVRGTRSKSDLGFSLVSPGG